MFSVVRLNRVIHLDKEKQPSSRGLGAPTSDATTFNVLYAEEWEMQKSGNSLLIARKDHPDWQYEIPWHHVDSALQEEEKKPAAKGKAP
jgi:hypothetical protein